MTIDTIYRFNRFLFQLSGFFGRFENSTSKTVGEFDQRLERQRTRKQLLNLDERQLRDIGITRAQAETEAKRDFWD